MSFPLGVFPASVGAGPEDGALVETGFLRLTKAGGVKNGGGDDSSSRKGAESARKEKQASPKKIKPAKKHQKSLSSRVLAANKRARAESNPVKNAEKKSLDERPGSTPAEGSQGQAFELPETSPRGQSTTRPRHIPIVIPDYESVDRSDSFSTWISSDSEPPSATDASTLSTRNNSVDSSFPKPKHVEIKIPSWAQPVLKQPAIAPRVSISQSVFDHPFLDVPELSPGKSQQATPPQSDYPMMESNSSAVSPNRLGYANPGNAGSHAFLSSAHSSQSSLVGQREEYESASEAEGGQDERGPGNTPSQSLSGTTPAAGTPGSTSTNLSGLVCNVHRTTGKEPHPLVGATTTILGDKLYVFGGRRLSRTKPQLTSNLYELDLVRRHWTKLDTKGDIPPPRYFHSICALGDSKLVCYGGMSANTASTDGGEGQPEVTVMSDIHIYDVPTRTWMRINTPDAPQGRYAHCAAVLPSSAVFSSANAPMSAVHHNPSGSNPNQGTLGVALDGTGGAEMIVVGGQDSANHYIEQVSVFNLRSLKWSGTTNLGRSCGAYRSVVTPLTTMSGSQIGAGPHARSDVEEEDDEPEKVGSGAPMLIYSNYNFLDVKLELQVRQTDGTLVEKPMKTEVSPPGLRFPNGGVIANHFVVSGTFLTSSKQEYALWALDLRTLTWSRIDGGGSIFSQGSWNRGVLWSRRNAFIVLGNRKRSLVDDYNNRRINFTNFCLLELEAFGLYDNPRRTDPMSGFVSASASGPHPQLGVPAAGRVFLPSAEEIGAASMNFRELADMDFLAIDGTRIPVNSRLIARRWGPHFNALMRESLVANSDTDAATLRPTASGHPSRNSAITITPSVNSNATTLTANTHGNSEAPDARSAPPSTRPRLFYLPHTAPTLQALLHYLYTSTLPSPPSQLATPQILCSLLQLARPYKIDGLLEAVVERLHESLDGRNAAAIFNAAAMGAGGGEGITFAAPQAGNRESTIPLRTASLAGLDGLMVNGANGRGNPLRIDTDMANGRSTRNTLRPGQPLNEDSEDEVPDSAATDASQSEDELTLSARSFSPRSDRDKEVWNGSMSAVVGLQKRGLRGLMEGRRLRERGRSDGVDARVGLGIA